MTVIKIPNRQYIKGRRIEYEIMNLLRLQGMLAIRTAGSHSPFDVIGVSSKEILLIQSKSKYAKRDLLKLRKIDVPPIKFVRKQLWVRNKGGFAKYE